MKIDQIPSEIYIFKVKDFKEKKKKLLSYIDSIDCDKRDNIENGEILYTDFHANIEYTSKSYFNYFMGIVNGFLDEFKQHLNSSSVHENLLQVSGMWFQKYPIKGTHSWHYHAGPDVDYSSVLYVNLPNKSQPTVFKSNNIEYTPDLEEGDFIIFPATLLHSSPVSKSKEMKTIISCNLLTITTD